MFSFKPITAFDYELFSRYLDINKFINSEYNFTTWFTWGHVLKIEHTIIEECLCVKGVSYGEEYFYLPLGEKEQIKKALLRLIGYCDGRQPLVLMSMSDDMVKLIEEFGLMQDFEHTDRREFYDYVYKHEKLITLSGKKLHGKRNHYNYFVSNFESSMEDITDDNLEECKKMINEMVQERSITVNDELNVTMNSLLYRKELRLMGGVLMVDGKVAGVILAENFYGMVIIHIAKSNTNIRGAAVALFKMFLEKYFSDCEYVNFTDDMGLEGLRQAKLSYAPDYFIEKCSLKGK